MTISLGKDAFYKQINMDLKNAYAFTTEVMARNMQEYDAHEGIDAFLEKRSPNWRGRWPSDHLNMPNLRYTDNHIASDATISKIVFDSRIFSELANIAKATPINTAKLQTMRIHWDEYDSP